MDREDLYLDITTLNHVVNYAKTTVREMERLEVQPDKFTLEIIELLQQGTIALQGGFRKLSTDQASTEENANAARKAERSTDKIYRKAFDEHSELVAIAFAFVVDIFKRTEVYRHLSMLCTAFTSLVTSERDKTDQGT